MAVTVISKIKQKNAADFAIIDDIDINGGLRIVDDITARDNIPESRRKDGMLVKVISDGETYELQNDLTTWLVWAPGTAAPEVLIYATQVSLLASTPSAGKLGFAQDTDNTYVRTTSGWEPVNSTVDGGVF